MSLKIKYDNMFPTFLAMQVLKPAKYTYWSLYKCSMYILYSLLTFDEYLNNKQNYKTIHYNIYNLWDRVSSHI